MLAAFLQFDDETVLVIGLTNSDLALMITGGDEPPTLNLRKMALDLESPMPSRLSFLVGETNEDIQARIQDELSADAKAREIPAEQVATYLDNEGDAAAFGAAADAQEAEQAAEEARLEAARALAVAKARARLN